YTLEALLTFHGADSKAIVWAHNSHIGDAGATEMSARGEHNIGHLCRKKFGEQAYLVGFGTNGAAGASEKLRAIVACDCLARFLLGLRDRSDLCGPKGLGKPRLERAIGVIYRPESELASQYFQAALPQQFDEYIWFNDARAVTPFDTAEIEELPDTYPVGVRRNHAGE